ncbi:MAG: hypothetical protein BWK80_30100 [Desulfobacteraceae bacterium IS3]|nr:MAG: hypothetical protein BWK80_30100 [Desulfobacteraceae bacterium IS3]
MYNSIAVIEGDGVGPEVIREALKIGNLLTEKYGLELEFHKLPYGADYYLDTGITLPDEVLKAMPEKYSGLLFGALGDPRIKDHRHIMDILGGLRFRLDLYVNFRPARLMNTGYCPLKKITQEREIDFVVFKENTEDLYINSGGIFKKGTEDEVAIENAVHTRKGVKRIITAGFDYAATHKKNRVCLGDKSNVMRYAGDLWQRTFYEIGAEYPEIEKQHKYIDALCMDIIRNPSNYDVIITSNMFGDILTDVAAEIQGGMGVAASCNYNPQHEKFLGLFEPVHGSAPDIAGRNIANPIGAILSFNMLLERLGFKKEADSVYNAIKKAMDKGVVTTDLGGNASTSEVGDFICENIKEAGKNDDHSRENICT